MNGFFKALGIAVALFTAISAILALLDGYCNRNRIRGKYLLCETNDD